MSLIKAIEAIKANCKDTLEQIANAKTQEDRETAKAEHAAQMMAIKDRHPAHYEQALADTETTKLLVEVAKVLTSINQKESTMETKNPQTPANTTNPKANFLKKLKAHTAKAASTTGSAVVNSVAEAHKTGVKYVAKVTDTVNGLEWLVVDETKEGALAAAKAIAQKLTKATILLFTVPVAYAAGFIVGAAYGFYSVFRDAYASKPASKEQVAKLEAVGTPVKQ